MPKLSDEELAEAAAQFGAAAGRLFREFYKDHGTLPDHGAMVFTADAGNRGRPVVAVGPVGCDDPTHCMDTLLRAVRAHWDMIAAQITAEDDDDSRPPGPTH